MVCCQEVVWWRDQMWWRYSRIWCGVVSKCCGEGSWSSNLEGDKSEVAHCTHQQVMGREARGGEKRKESGETWREEER